MDQWNPEDDEEEQGDDEEVNKDDPMGMNKAFTKPKGGGQKNKTQHYAVIRCRVKELSMPHVTFANRPAPTHACNQAYKESTKTSLRLSNVTVLRTTSWKR